MTLKEELRSKLLMGIRVRPIDYPKHRRPQVQTVLLQLRDELPIRASWEKLNEKHVDGTRLTCRVYWIREEARLGLVFA